MSPIEPESLVLTRDGVRLFTSRGRWLYPLFDLERFLAGSGVSPHECLLHDKLIGKAAALLIVRLGIVKLTTGVLSVRGEEVLKAHGVDYRATETVDKLLCRTEDLLEAVNDTEEAYRLVKARIGADL